MKRQGSIRRQPTSKLSFAGLRRFPRKDLAMTVLLQDEEGWEIPVESVDFSPSGMFIGSHFLFEKGTIHNLIFRSPGGDQLFSIRAKVVRVESGAEDGLSGMAYEFLEMASKKQRCLVEITVAA